MLQVKALGDFAQSGMRTIPVRQVLGCGDYLLTKARVWRVVNLTILCPLQGLQGA